ncbi:hypothetical protein [Breznakiella homolactica]|uniref:cGAS/DncV-like nucleotidyltransferase C-terminal helical domain-containing protein n=1 Tax=Breznakiella homolactica TaxID=2798577 RepID=A0A7T7XJI8_9SPIR|nr:hypothetical protein [Breznakiella homolactica]QQO07575.1 hypothetical protein JFL75_11520 [Breznakiella homolactica]
MGIKNKLEKLRQRRTDNDVLFASIGDSISYSVRKSLREKSYESAGLSENEIYIIESMREVENEYTQKSFSEADRIFNQLTLKGLVDVEFEYQGSVTNNTNIKYVSDIDLLIICKRFYSLAPPLKPTIPYKGDPLQDLKKIRSICIKILKEAFPAADIDTTKSKCISISGGSLKRKVDLVMCNWYHTSKYEETQDETYLGVNILDYHNNERVDNFPFLHNYYLHEKDENTNGKFKQLIRLVKSIKNDSDEEIDISSYEITALLYHMSNQNINNCRSAIETLKNISSYFYYLITNQNYLEKLFVPNQTVKISDSLNKNELLKLIKVIIELAEEL